MRSNGKPGGKLDSDSKTGIDVGVVSPGISVGGAAVGDSVSELVGIGEGAEFSEFEGRFGGGAGDSTSAGGGL